MKKILWVLSYVVCVSLLICSCGQAPSETTPFATPTAPTPTTPASSTPATTAPPDTPKIIQLNNLIIYEVAGTYDNGDGGVHTADYEFSTAAVDKSTIPQEVTVSFCGETYTGRYLLSAYNKAGQFAYHQYHGNRVFFSVRADTGELASIQWLNDMEKNASLSAESCRALADQIAKEIIDLSSYRVTEEVTPTQENNYLYSYLYYRPISGLVTSDSIKISIDGNGNVASIGYFDLGAFSEITEAQWDTSKVEQLIHEKLKQIYPSASTERTHKINNVTLIRLNDGRAALLYNISNYFTQEDENGTLNYSSAIQLLVTTE